MSAASFGTLSASTSCVSMSTFHLLLTSFLVASGFSRDLLARWIFVKTPAFCAHLCATTLPTPPAPMIRIVPVLMQPPRCLVRRKYCPIFLSVVLQKSQISFRLQQFRYQDPAAGSAPYGVVRQP